MDGPDGTSNKAPTCVTEHPGFLAVCTNKWVLQTACYQYIQQYKEDAYRNKEEHKVNRHLHTDNLLGGVGEFWERKSG